MVFTDIFINLVLDDLHTLGIVIDVEIGLGVIEVPLNLF